MKTADMKINIDTTELTESNYDDFMLALDAEFERQHPNQGLDTYSKTLSKETWLLDHKTSTVQDIIDGEVECWEGD